MRISDWSSDVCSSDLIQQTLLPKQVPEPLGWKLARYYQPAREVGGDFYDFLTLSDGRLGIVIGDVTDKGVPRSEERRVGKECVSKCRSRRSPSHKKNT